MIRVRIAPSPTGYLHVGTARTALYNWLFARHNNGKFILRIEDTDVERSSEEMVQVILDGLKWLGLDWDEGPYFQSVRLQTYREYAEKLVAEGKAYFCYCTPEELDERRQKAMAQGKSWKYDRRCLNLSAEERRQREAMGIKPAVRFLVPEGKTTFYDLVHNELTKDHQDIEDFVVLRSNGLPTYNFAVVVDDHTMGITHVIRGDDHIPNTPKQILVYEALGWDVPKFAHLPLILAEDKSKLSKRHGAVAITEYRDEGYLPEAFVNFLALLGWSPGGDREIITQEEMIELFTLERVNKRGAVFDTKKLAWMNSEYIKMLDLEDLFNRVLPFFVREGLITEEQARKKKDWIIKILELVRERAVVLKDFVDLTYYFFRDDFEYEEKGIKKHFSKEGVAGRLTALIEIMDGGVEPTAEGYEQAWRALAERLGIKAGLLIHPTRLALTGRTVGPSLFHLMELIPPEEIKNRLTRAREYVIRMHGEHKGGAIV